MTILRTNETLNAIDQATEPAQVELQSLLDRFVAPAGQQAVAAALFNLRIDLIAAVVNVAGATWQDEQS